MYRYISVEYYSVFLHFLHPKSLSSLSFFYLLDSLLSVVFVMVSELDPSSMASNTTSSTTRELSPLEDPRSPFILHHGESPGAILVVQPLIEDNYPNWARAMRMALDAKSKLGFVDGSITASMAITPFEKKAWSKCNSMISSWILNSVSP